MGGVFGATKDMVRTKRLLKKAITTELDIKHKAILLTAKLSLNRYDFKFTVNHKVDGTEVIYINAPNKKGLTLEEAIIISHNVNRLLWAKVDIFKRYKNNNKGYAVKVEVI